MANSEGAGAGDFNKSTDYETAKLSFTKYMYLKTTNVMSQKYPLLQYLLVSGAWGACKSTFTCGSYQAVLIILPVRLINYSVTFGPDQDTGQMFTPLLRICVIWHEQDMLDSKKPSTQQYKCSRYHNMIYTSNILNNSNSPRISIPLYQSWLTYIIN